METNAENHQGRARGLYDEQLQRQRQEKLLLQTGRRPRAVVAVREPEPQG